MNDEDEKDMEVKQDQVTDKDRGVEALKVLDAFCAEMLERHSMEFTSRVARAPVASALSTLAHIVEAKSEI